jgi:hypothetical protein
LTRFKNIWFFFFFKTLQLSLKLNSTQILWWFFIGNLMFFSKKFTSKISKKRFFLYRFLKKSWSFYFELSYIIKHISIITRKKPFWHYGCHQWWDDRWMKCVNFLIYLAPNAVLMKIIVASRKIIVTEFKMASKVFLFFTQHFQKCLVFNFYFF